MSDNNDKTVRRLAVDTGKFLDLVSALTECIETDEYDYGNVCIHKLTLPDGRKCQVLLEIEQEDENGDFPSELEFKPVNSCIKTAH